VDDAWQIDANAGISASKNAAKCLKGQKSQRNDAKNGVMAEDLTQKSLHQTIRLREIPMVMDYMVKDSLNLSRVLLS
jgi:hypothetical protein